MIEAFITNAGKYAEGELTGEWLKFPATKETVQALLSRIGVDGVSYEEYFITGYKSDVSGLRFAEYENIDELNYLAALLYEMDDFTLDKYEASAIRGDYNMRAKDLINCYFS